MFFSAYGFVAAFLVDMASCGKDAVRPERYLSISGLLGEQRAFLYEPSTDSQSSRPWFDQKKTQLGDGLGFSYEKY